MYELKIYLLNLETESKKILGIIVGSNLDDAIIHAESIYKNAKFISVNKIISWSEFKGYFTTDLWPEEYRDNDSGLFDIEELYEASLFVRDLISRVLDRNYSLKIQMSSN